MDFRFPNQEDIRKRWLLQINDPSFVPSIWSVVCSAHFEPDCFEQKTKRRDLKAGSYPTLFLKSSDNLKCLPVESVSVDHNYIKPTQNELKRRLDKATDVLVKYKKKIKTLQRTNQRKTKTCKTLTDVILELKENNLLSANGFQKLSDCGSRVPALLFQRLTDTKHQNCVSRKEYPDELKRFALTLQFYSSKGYNYVRQNFNFCLPHEYSIRRWYSSVQSETGTF